MLLSSAWLVVGRASLGQPSTLCPACQWGLPVTEEWPSATVWGGPSYPWLHDLPAQAAPAATARRAFPWQSPGLRPGLPTPASHCAGSSFLRPCSRRPFLLAWGTVLMANRGTQGWAAPYNTEYRQAGDLVKGGHRKPGISNWNETNAKCKGKTHCEHNYSI